MKTLLATALLLMGSLAFAQTEKVVSPMKEGTKLNADDIGFLHMVAKKEVNASRGDADRSVVINGLTFKEGQTLSATDAVTIGRAVSMFQADYKTPEASRGLCWYWYWYCDYYGYCRWFKYYYYC